MYVSWVLSHVVFVLLGLLYLQQYLLRVGVRKKKWLLDPGLGGLPPYHFFLFIFWHSWEVSPWKNLLPSVPYFYAGLVTFTQPPVYLFSSFCCWRSCLTGLAGEFNLPLSNAFQGFSPPPIPRPAFICEPAMWLYFCKLISLLLWISRALIRSVQSQDELLSHLLSQLINQEMRQKCTHSSGYFLREFLWIFTYFIEFKVEY